MDAAHRSTVRLTLRLGAFGWAELDRRALGREAARQRVSLERLLAHAALFYLADAGPTAAR